MLWDIYVDRVDPLVKILHLPTFRPLLESAVQRPKGTPSDIQALVSSFFLAAIASLDNGECARILGGYKKEAFAKYDRAARRALRGARFVSTTSITTLRAYCLFLVRTAS